MRIFRDRIEAGQCLAEQLAHFSNRKDVVVLGLPRGGIPVAFEIAKALNVTLDVFLVRKLGVPWQKELAMGAIAMGDVQVLNNDIIQDLGIPMDSVAQVAEKEREELERRNVLYRQNQQAPDLSKRTVILVDDGVATGATIHAAISAIKQLDCESIIIAVPVAPPETVDLLNSEVDEVYCLETPIQFFAIGSWYEDFTQTTDEEVCDLLARSRQSLGQ